MVILGVVWALWISFVKPWASPEGSAPISKVVHHGSVGVGFRIMAPHLRTIGSTLDRRTRYQP